MANGSIYGVEALSRWTHPKFGSVSPASFIPLAEECGLIHDLSDWVLTEVCNQLAVWRQRGLQIPCVSINLSPLSFHNRNLSQRIFSELTKHNLPPSSLTVELTEGVLLDTNPTTLQVLDDIHQMGIGLAIDDFGTGYSSLSYLQKIPIKELKLDISFVTDVHSDATSKALSQAIIQIGNSLNLDVVAEGVEENLQLAELKAQGYHIGQGFLFSKPLQPDELEKWMQTNMDRLQNHCR